MDRKKRHILLARVGAAISNSSYYIKKAIRKRNQGKTIKSAKIRRLTGFYEGYIKRPFDIICSILAIVVFWWLYLLIAILVKIKLGSPVLFTQSRPGKAGKIFKLYKFRTMNDQRDEDGNLLPDEVRLTSFGRKLRETSLDELPEVFNVLKGDMSIVGPRPLLVEYLPFYTEEEKHRHDVRPGLSGLAQVHGRNAISWEDKFAWDLKYVNKITFIGDIYIISQTVIKVLKRSDILVGSQHKSGRLDVVRAVVMREEA